VGVVIVVVPTAVVTGSVGSVGVVIGGGGKGVGGGAG
jgi:hypothetical protein